MTALSQASASYPEAAFEVGSTLIVEGGQASRLYVLIDGELAVLRAGAEIAIIAEPGAIVGEMSVLLGAAHTATVIAKRMCRMHVIEDGPAFLRSNPDVIFDVARMLAQRLQVISGYLADLKLQFADRHDHFGMVDEILNSLSQHHSDALKLGSDRETDPRL